MQDLIRRAADIVMAGGLVAYPTDTFYGLACDPRNPHAIARLFAAKNRDGRRPSPLVGASLEQVSAAVDLNAVARRLAAAFWPGPLALVLPARAEIQRTVLGGLDTAAVRVPADATARALAEAVGFCITATSANLSGEPPVARASEISRSVAVHLDFVLDGGPVPGGAASTIVDVTAAEPRLIRAGPIAWDRVLESLR
ncbi:MAG: threonylcarbamoyl-AMP synthase [Acidobacteria bacterium]|nr:threonylcarbamoyl-AMP synthase [Acidobacteriota bacterium]